MDGQKEHYVFFSVLVWLKLAKVIMGCVCQSLIKKLVTYLDTEQWM